MRNSCRDRVYNRIQAKNENAEVGLIAHEKFTTKNKTQMKTQNVIFNIIKEIFKGSMYHYAWYLLSSVYEFSTREV